MLERRSTMEVDGKKGERQGGKLGPAQAGRGGEVSFGGAECEHPGNMA